MVASEGEHLLGLAEVLLERGDIVFFDLVRLAVEVAEAASRGADIRGVDVAVNLPRHNLGVAHHGRA